MRRYPWMFALFCLLGLRSAGAMPPTESGSGLLGEELLGDARLPNWVTPTLGGRQFWADQVVFHGWRIQRNVFTGHCRLLDEKNLRRAWGSLAACEARLDEIRREQNLEPMRGTVVVVLHGLFRSRSAMSGMAEHLEQAGGLQVVNVTYPTTRGDLGEHARSLRSVVEHLDGAEKIHFVAHSLGNLVIRRYLADTTDPARGVQPDPRIGRIVMLGPPNQGASLAKILRGAPLFNVVAGQSGVQLAADWEQVQRQLATPHGEFGIIAGGNRSDHGHNPLLVGDDDLVVRVEETKLSGASDFLVLPVLHSFMMNDADVRASTVRYLHYGYFTSPRDRHPLPAAVAEPQPQPQP